MLFNRRMKCESLKMFFNLLEAVTFGIGFFRNPRTDLMLVKIRFFTEEFYWVFRNKIARLINFKYLLLYLDYSYFLLNNILSVLEWFSRLLKSVAVLKLYKIIETFIYINAIYQFLVE